MTIPFDASLLWGTLVLRPYVAAFLIVFLVAGARDLGLLRVLGFLAWGFAVAFSAEWASTRIGVPFGLYHYTESTRGLELYLSNVPVFDSLSFPFLAYASFCLARSALQSSRGLRVVLLGGVLMTLLDVVIDPLAVRGDEWFLGRIFYYPAGGPYFGVPLSNFAGWLIVGWLIIGGYVWASERLGARGPGRVELGMGLYYGVLAFNLVLTAWIGATKLLTAGILVHLGGALLLYGVSVWSRSAGPGRIGPVRQGRIRYP